MKYLIDIFEEYVEKSPEKPVYAEYNGGGEYLETSFSDLHKEVMGFAFAIEKSGAQYGDRVALIFRSSARFMAGFLACHYKGMIPVPLEMVRENSDPSRWENYIENSEAVCILTAREVKDELSEIFSSSSRLSKLQILTSIPGEVPAEPKRVNENGVILYTSGSTGNPKGVVMTQEGILLNVEGYCRKIDSDETSIFASWMPYYHVMGLVTSLLTALYKGNLMVLVKGSEFIENPLLWLRAMSDYECNYSICSNFAFKLTSEAVKNCREGDMTGVDLKALRWILAGGEIMNVNSMMEFTGLCSRYNMGKDVVSFGYGQTEATACISIYSSENPMHWVKIDRSKLGEGTLEVIEKGLVSELTGELKAGDGELLLTGNGTHLEDHKIIILDSRGEDAGAHKIGEIAFYGTSMIPGYWKNREATEKLFGKTEAGIKYTKTGDIGFLDENGELFITGRVKDIIIIKGLNYYPDDIEFSVNRVAGDDAVYGSCAVSLTGDSGEELIVVKETQKHGEAGYAELSEDIRNEIVKTSGIATGRIVFVSAYTLPRTGSGKIKRSRVKDLINRGTLPETNYQWEGVTEPEKSTEAVDKVIRSIIAGSKGVAPEEISEDMLFTELGMGSLMLMELVETIKKRIGVYVSIALLFEKNNIRKLSEHIEGMVK